MFLFLEGFQPEMFLLSSCFSCTFLAVNGCLCSSTLDPRPSALGPHLVGPRPQNIARLNTILLFNFEVVTTLKL